MEVQKEVTGPESHSNEEPELDLEPDAPNSMLYHSWTNSPAPSRRAWETQVGP